MNGEARIASGMDTVGATIVIGVWSTSLATLHHQGRFHSVEIGGRREDHGVDVPRQSRGQGIQGELEPSGRRTSAEPGDRATLVDVEARVEVPLEPRERGR